MKRKRLKDWLGEFIKEYEGKPIEYWESLDQTNLIEKMVEGTEIQVHIDIIQSTDEWIQAGFSATSGGLSSYLPVCTSLIIDRGIKGEKSLRQ